MASRRPPSRARLNNSANPMPPPQPSRSRSAMSKSISSTRSLDDNQTQRQKNLPQQPQLAQDDAETNIQVVIRCRRRSEREIQDNTPIIVSMSGAKSHEVSIETAAPVSSLGLVTLPPQRTYPFDLVFGPEADQAIIYHHVVSPMLDEVIMGYNCTLFAYGQTGTGKTYTMQGDLTPTPMGNPSVHAGMIPRVLFRLFHHLETSETDYSVKISFVELYNEELRDLLANDLSAPAGTTQPMGMASQDKNNDGGLKIFDDATKRGVFIQGLEEISVKDCSDALALLTKGSHRRQIAATKFNDHSSRSHSVFSIVVHIKEKSTLGDDLLKIGKLNLVDLAGSENIGRSGAENKRAREAGMINQSLLTLGRVINALVDKSSHIPYRESKLTRLLRDSLGGRTKTCIIATISPARSNMEETLSTLDYAIRAKSIRNKPELNQRMTRNSLLKEYIAEIERLKADLLAAREKNGIFFSEETWNQLNAEQELRQTEMEEAKKQIEIVESQMRATREEFEQSIALLTKRDGELKETRDKLKETEDVLEIKQQELNGVKVSLEEEIMIRQTYQENEKTLDEVAGGLRTVAKKTVRDLGGVFDKLERKSSVLNSNSKAVLTHGKTISSTTHALSNKLEEFIKSSSQRTVKLRTEVKQFENNELETLAAHSERIEQQLQRVHEALGGIKARDGTESEALIVVQNALTETHQTFKTGFGAWGEGLQRSCEGMCKQAELAGKGGFTAVEKALKVMGSLVETIAREAQEYVNTESERVAEAKALANSAANYEIKRLKQQNEALSRMLENEKIKAERANGELIGRLSQLLGDFTKERDMGLKEAIEVVQGENGKAVEGMMAFVDKHGEVMNGMENRGSELRANLERRGGEGKRTRDGVLKTSNAAKSALSDELNKIRSSISGSMTAYSTQMQKHTQAMDASCTNAFDRYSRAKKARVEATNSIAVDVQSELRHLQQSLASTSRAIEAVTGEVVSESTELANVTATYHDASVMHLSSIDQSMQALVAQGTNEDTALGTTPRKRVWDYVDHWELTKSRDSLLRTWREQGSSRTRHQAFVEEHLPNEGLDGDREMAVDEANFLPVDSDMPSPLAHPTAGPPASSIPDLHHALPPRKAGIDCKAGVPTLGTLTDSRMANIHIRGSRRGR